MEKSAMKELESKDCESSDDATIRSCRNLKENAQPPAKKAKLEAKTCLAVLRGEGAVEKALKLKGACKCDVDGCKIVVDKVLAEDDGLDNLVIGELNLPEWKRAEIRDSMKQAQKHD